MGYYRYDIYYLILVLPAIFLGLYAQFKVSSTFNKFNSLNNQKGLTGLQVARRILDQNGLQDIRIERVSGKLSDHYSHKEGVIRLSDSVFNSTSVGAIGVAAHEVGHAIQYKEEYKPIQMRNILIPVTQVGSFLAIPILIFGFALEATGLVWLGIGLYSLMAVFQLVTLPVEFDASKRALAVLSQDGILEGYELEGAKKVLNAAALTYVAALIATLAQLLRFVLLAASRSRD